MQLCCSVGSRLTKLMLMWMDGDAGKSESRTAFARGRVGRGD